MERWLWQTGAQSHLHSVVRHFIRLISMSFTLYVRAPTPHKWLDCRLHVISHNNWLVKACFFFCQANITLCMHEYMMSLPTVVVYLSTTAERPVVCVANVNCWVCSCRTVLQIPHLIISLPLRLTLKALTCCFLIKQPLWELRSDIRSPLLRQSTGILGEHTSASLKCCCVPYTSLY